MLKKEIFKSQRSIKTNDQNRTNYTHVLNDEKQLKRKLLFATNFFAIKVVFVQKMDQNTVFLFFTKIEYWQRLIAPLRCLILSFGRKKLKSKPQSCNRCNMCLVTPRRNTLIS